MTFIREAMVADERNVTALSTFGKKVFVVIFVVLGFWSLAFSAEFYASRNSNKYHRPSCILAYRIKPSNLIIFKSPEEAAKTDTYPARYACLLCHPSKTDASCRIGA
jgi:hypothetical protein